MESNLIGLDFSVFDISLVTDQANWYIWTNLGKVLVPFGHVSISVSGGQVEHDQSTVGIDIIAFS
jgi:hypothetical protein